MLYFPLFTAKTIVYHSVSHARFHSLIHSFPGAPRKRNQTVSFSPSHLPCVALRYRSRHRHVPPSSLHLIRNLLELSQPRPRIPRQAFVALVSPAARLVSFQPPESLLDVKAQSSRHGVEVLERRHSSLDTPSLSFLFFRRTVLFLSRAVSISPLSSARSPVVAKF